MATPDYGHRKTDQGLADLEKRIAKVYREAWDDMEKTVIDYFTAFEERDAKMKKLVGKEVNGKIWTEQDYLQWRLTQIARGERFDDLVVKLAERYTQANEVALAYVNDATPGIYALNRNYAAYTIEKVSGNVGFTLWDESTVRRLIVEEPDLMPYYPKEKALKRGIDLKYGKKQITSAVTSGILRGNSVGKIASDLQVHMSGMNRSSAVRAARTAITGAQNAGRMDSYAAADKMGIKMRKRWIATKDGRTRHSHRRLDGQTIEWDKEFSNGCRYPGDPRGKPGETYNCRCSLRTVEAEGVEAEPRQMRVRDPKTGRNVLVNEMTYNEWEQWVQNRQYGDIIGERTSNGIKIQSVSVHSVDRGNERGVTSAAVSDAITNPLYVSDIKTDSKGKRSQRFIGKEATVNVNPDTGNIATVWKTGKKQRRKYGGDE